METPKEEKEEAPPPVFLDRAARVSRGKRMTKLLDTEIEEDESFWNQDALKEEEYDNNYEQEPEIADEFDSDFEDVESEPDDENDNDAVERPQTKKRLIFPGKMLKKVKKKKEKEKKKQKVVSDLDEPSNDEYSSQHPAALANQDAPDEAEGERTVRKSTRTSVIIRQAERDAIRAALQATMKPIKRKKEGEEKRMSQEEMLLEAAQTEIMNLRNLERVLAREEEVKKKAIMHKAVYSGPLVRYVSKNGCTCLEFRGLSFKSELPTSAPPYPEKAVCVVTGLPAKYRDPKTGLPYATKEAFKIIRERFVEEIKPPRLGRTGNEGEFELDMGALFDSLNGKGFSRKRKRSRKRNGSRMSRVPYFLNLGPSPRSSSVETEEGTDYD